MRNIFLQIFSKGFYKRYAKSLLLAFTMIASYFLYMQTAGVFLTENTDYWSMFVSIKLMTEPVFALLFCLVALLYTGMAIRYARREITETSNLFLFYTFMGAPKRQRWQTWAETFFVILLPLYIYILYSLIVSYYNDGGQYGSPILLFLIAINVGAAICMDTLSRAHASFKQTKKRFGTRFIPLNLILLINHYYNNKVILMATKAVILLTVYLFREPLAALDFRLTILLALILACLNVALLYQDFVFQSQRMTFMLNFPKTTFNRFIAPTLYYIILIFPEIVFVTASSNISLGILFTGVYLIFLFFLNSLVLSIGNRPLQLSKAMMLYFFVSLLFILYKATIILMISSLLIAILLFYKLFRYNTFQNNQNS